MDTGSRALPQTQASLVAGQGPRGSALVSGHAAAMCARDRWLQHPGCLGSEPDTFHTNFHERSFVYSAMVRSDVAIATSATARSPC